MPNLFTSLSDITSEYTVFETDQVLTAEQLNSISSYLDDQTRLSRTQLIGVGLLCGLQVKFDKTYILISQGVAISSDGDLMQLPVDSRYDRFKAYDESMPVYPLFYKDNETMLEAYELLEQGGDDPNGEALTEFDKATDTDFSDWVVVLLMESYIKDNDLCSSTGCDNLGKVYAAKLKPLLVAKSAIDRLKPNIQTPRSAALKLKPLDIIRVKLSDSISNSSQFFSQYRSASEQLLKELESELPSLWRELQFLLEEMFKKDPTPGWISTLNQYFQRLRSDENIQYYYDFLKDVITKVSELKEAK